jgi:Cu(I)/Ag(I) efflux system membrane protein CusA/SilA
VRDGIISHTAAPMIGGMITAPLLSMLVLPAVYRILYRRELGQSKPG